MNDRSNTLEELKYMALRERFGQEIAKLQDEIATLRAELTLLHESHVSRSENVV